MEPNAEREAREPTASRGWGAAALRLTGHPHFRWLVVLLFLLIHLYRLDDPPNGFHRWRETDTVAVARNFATESWNILRPRIDARGAGDGVVGMEFPAYSYAVALLSRAGGDIHVWGRLLTVLGACAALLAFRRVVLLVTGEAALAGLAMFCAANAPLLVFYGRKMQPDPWGLALATVGLAAFLSWLEGGRARHGIAAAACVALAGGIKPTFLGIGLPMLFLLWRRQRWSLVRRWRNWLFAAGAVLPVVAWFAYARSLNPAGAPSYYYLGGDWSVIAASLGGAQFYKNVFRTWLFEMQIGLLLVWAFVLGIVRWRRVPHFGFFLAWLVGCYVTFALTARHCATAHDYYTLSVVLPLAVISAAGVREALRARWQVVQVFTIGILLALPATGFARIERRYGEPYDFAKGRRLAAEHIPKGVLVVTLDKTPCFLLYESGRKGWHLGPGSSVADFEAAVRGGARVLLVDEGAGFDLTPFAAHLGPALYRDDWLTAYPIQ